MNMTALYTEQKMMETFLASPGWKWQAAKAAKRLDEYRNQLEVKGGDEAVRLQGKVAELRLFLSAPADRLAEIEREIEKGAP